jgi:hypothetical protein
MEKTLGFGHYFAPTWKHLPKVARGPIVPCWKIRANLFENTLDSHTLDRHTLEIQSLAIKTLNMKIPVYNPSWTYF